MEVSKKSFEYKVSKKVAELIQVVHMLFTKNHEREIELQATKDAYEDEISNVIRDARNRLEQIQQTLNDEKRRCEVQVKKVELEAKRKEDQYELKLCEAHKKAKGNEERVTILQKQNEQLLEQLSQKQSEVDALQKLNENLSCELRRQEQTEAKESNDSQAKDLAAALAKCKAELQRRGEELEKLHAQLDLEETSTLKSQYEKMIDQLKTDFHQSKANFKIDTDNLQHQLLEIRKENERLEQKNKSLELYLKRLKEHHTELKSSSSSSVHEQKQEPSDSANSQATSRSPSIPMTSQQGSYVVSKLFSNLCFVDNLKNLWPVSETPSIIYARLLFYQ